MPSTTVASGDADELEHRRTNVDAVRELRAQVATALDPVRPGDDHRVTCSTQVAPHLLAPLERCVAGVSPRSGEVGGCVEAAPLLDAAPFLDQLQLFVGLEHNAVEEGR